MNEKKTSREILNEELTALKERIASNIMSAGMNASGRTIASMRVEVDEKEGTLFGRRAFEVLESGRRPGRVPRAFYQIIYQWAVDKRIHVRNLKSFAYLTARKIAREGTLLYREGGRNDIYTPEIRECIENVRKRGIAMIQSQIQTIKLHD